MLNQDCVSCVLEYLDYCSISKFARTNKEHSQQVKVFTGPIFYVGQILWDRSYWSVSEINYYMVVRVGKTVSIRPVCHGYDGWEDSKEKNIVCRPHRQSSWALDGRPTRHFWALKCVTRMVFFARDLGDDFYSICGEINIFPVWKR